MVGANSNYAIERPYVKYLRQQEGIQSLEFFKAQDIFLNYYKRGLVQKLLFRFGLSAIYRQINEQFCQLIETFRPDVVLVFKGMEIFPETLLKAKGKGIKLANYNPDNPFLFSGRGSGNKNVTDSIGIYDLHFSYDRLVKEKIEETYRIPCHLLPFGFELDDRLFELCQQVAEINKMCFLGNPDKQRALFLTNLADLNIPIDVYGHGWASWISHNNVSIFGAVFGDLFWVTLRKYRVQLNLMRVHNLQSHNMRTFEIPAVGGIELAPNTLDHRSFFNNGTEIFLFDRETDCAAKARQLLALSKEASEQLRIRARSRSIDAGYSYSHRAYQVFQSLRML